MTISRKFWKLVPRFRHKFEDGAKYLRLQNMSKSAASDEFSDVICVNRPNQCSARMMLMIIMQGHITDCNLHSFAAGVAEKY